MTMIKLAPEDLEELIRVTREAEKTPVIAMSLSDGLEGRDFATRAWNKVRDKWEELGKKYGFCPGRVKGINTRTGAVIV